jgi:O-antigen/teichoic acid export membrane protein
MPQLIAGIQSLRRRAMLISSARKLSRSPSLRSATFLAAGGVGFAVGNILLARVLPEAQFGAVALVLSLIQVGAALAAHGLPNLVIRHQLNASSGLLRQSTFSSLLAGAVVLAIAAALYDLDAFLALMLGVTVVLAGMGRVAGALFQSRGRFGFSLFLIQIHNWVLLASVPIVLLFRRPFAELVTAVILCSYLATSVLGWRLAARLPGDGTQPAHNRAFMLEALSAAGLALSSNIFFQIDRLVIGRALSLEDLARYSIVAAIAGSAFRMLQTGAGYSLTPRLRACSSRAQALVLIRHEAALVFAMGALAALVVVMVTPWLIERFLAGRYSIPGGLVAVVIATGFIRIGEAFAASVVVARGSARQLSLLNHSGWIALALALVCAWVARPFGLVGVVAGLGAGWFGLALAASTLAAHVMRDLGSTPSTTA